MMSISLTPLSVFVAILVALISRKVWMAEKSRYTLYRCGDSVSVESFVNDPEFKELVGKLKSTGTEPAVLMLNRFAINITLNWLCNTEEMAGVHQRLLIVALDSETERELRGRWPKVNVFLWEIPCIEGVQFSYGQPPYQLFQLFRSNFARALLEFQLSFWMIQADTFWRTNLFQTDFQEEKEVNDLIFDRAGSTGLQKTLIAGGYFWAKPSEASKEFFENLSRTLKWWYAPDNTIMGSLCIGQRGLRCGWIPYSLVASWQWFHGGMGVRDSPILFQFDCEEGSSANKLEIMQSFGLRFMKSDRSCDKEAVRRAVGMEPKSLLREGKSWKELQLSVYVWIAEWINSVPFLGTFFRRYIILFAYFLMITL